ncbi:MAG TPA: alpha-hydroxy acid oxidase [Acidobacteriota bacterium]|nr:alpha-hydroxy acid oxidase [Acidobacteriota bacterium]
MNTARRCFLRYMSLSPLAAYLNPAELFAESELNSPADAFNVFQFEEAMKRKLAKDVCDFINDGADDGKTIKANREAFDHVEIRARRLVNVANVDTRTELLGESLESPILIAPVGFQKAVHADGELAVARAAAAKKHIMIVSTVSSYSIEEIAGEYKNKVWFQLYPTSERTVARDLLQRAESAGCPVTALTVDTPVLGNRESQVGFLNKVLQSDQGFVGNFKNTDLRKGLSDPAMTWDMIPWMKSNTKMKIVIKGIVTREDAKLCVEHGADALVVSNHGGRQEESNRGTLDCLSEVVQGTEGKIPVLIDGGFRRGTDIFKALAMGAKAICIGRPYIWGLGAFGQPGVEKVLELLQAELVRIMRLAGTPSIKSITPAHVISNRC